MALALVGDPDLIFLDEPTTGFDPAARRHAWSTVRSLCELGKTVFLTTHYMDEAQALANRVAVMRAGEIIAIGRPDELGGREQRPAGVLVLTAEPVAAVHEITIWAVENAVELGHFSVTQPTLEDIYLELTGPATGDRTLGIARRRSDELCPDTLAAARSRSGRLADPL